MVSTWTILSKTLAFKLETSIDVVKAIVCLHNFRINKKLERGESIEDEIPECNIEENGLILIFEISRKIYVTGSEKRVLSSG